MFKISYKLKITGGINMHKDDQMTPKERLAGFFSNKPIDLRSSSDSFISSYYSNFLRM